MTNHQPVIPTEFTTSIDVLTYKDAVKECKRKAKRDGCMWHVTRTEVKTWLVVINTVMLRNEALKSYFHYSIHKELTIDDKITKPTWYEKIYHRL